MELADVEATQQFVLLNVMAHHCGETLTPDKVESIVNELWHEMTVGACLWAFQDHHKEDVQCHYK